MNPRFLLLLSAAALFIGIAAHSAGNVPVVRAQVTHIVQNLDDPGPGSLRTALNVASSGDTIVFSPFVSGTIELSSQLPTVTGTLTIDGDDRITIDAGENSRHFEVAGTGDLTLEGLTLVDGLTSGSGSENSGGAIFVSGGGELTIENSTLFGNASSATGSGVGGGAIWASDGVRLTITNSTLSDNTANGAGGAIRTGGNAEVTITNSTLYDNEAGNQGGAIRMGSGGDLTITNSTLSGNEAGDQGGAIRAISGGSATIANTIVAGNTAVVASQNCFIQSPISGSNNLSDTAGCGGSGITEVVTLDELALGEFGDHGGPTQTIPLLPGSVAIGAGDYATCIASPENGGSGRVDQRGFSRVDANGECDIGAYEVDAIEPGPGGFDQVTSLDDDILDELFDNDTCDLREAIRAAILGVAVGECNAPPGDIITFHSDLGDTENPADGTIEMVAGQFPTIIGGATVTINGDGRVTIDAGGDNRHFQVTSTGNLSLVGLTLEDGRGTGGGAANSGGAIHNSGALTIADSTLSGNTANGGGAIWNAGSGELTITDSTLSGNTASGGGAITNNGGELAITKSTLSGNQASSFGGAIYNNGGELAITKSTLSGNQTSGNGGAITNDINGEVAITNSTLSGNTANGGGAITNWHEVTITNSIVAGNTVGDQDIENCSIAAGSIEGSHNLSDDDSCGDAVTPDDVVELEALALGEFGDHGGPTQTIPLLPGSVAIDTGDDDLAVDPDGNALQFDQRGEGFPRIIGDAVDIGAYEAEQADLSVTKTGPDEDEVLAGEQIEYTITVANAGPNDAGDVVLTDVLPEHTTFVSISDVDDWTCDTPDEGEHGTVECTADVLEDGDDVEFTLTVEVSIDAPHGENIENTATVTSDTHDPNTDDNSSTADPVTVINQADLSVTKEGPGEVLAGDEQLEYTITVENAGPGPARDVVLTDELPDHTSFVEFSNESGLDCNHDDGTVTCTAEELAAEAEASVTLTLDVSIEAPDGFTLTNTATVTSDTHDPDETNNTATEETEVINRADLSVVKTGDTEVAAGGLIDYTIDVANAGPSTALGVEWSDTLPANTVFVSLDGPEDWECTMPDEGQAGTVECSIAFLASGDSASFSLIAAVDPRTSHGSTIENTATVTSSTVDPDEDNNSSTVETEVSNEASVVLSLIAPPVVEQGGVLVYSMSVANSGPNFAEGLTFETTLPDGTTFVSLSRATELWTCSTPIPTEGGDVECSLPSLAPGEMRFLFLRVEVGETVPVGTVLSLTATVDHLVPDPDPSNLTRTATTTVVEAVDPGEPEEPTEPEEPGEPVVYTLHYQWSLIAWVGEDGIAPGAALGDLSSVVTVIFGWDGPSQTWLAFFPGGVDVPGANDLESLDHGSAYWIAINDPDGAEWEVELP